MSSLVAKSKPLLRSVARATLRLFPQPAIRVSGPLAKNGGAPVRNLRFRPYAAVKDGSLRRWHAEARSLFRRIYLSDVEGLPQPLAEEFGRVWASYCGCRFGLLLPHGTDALRIGLAAALDQDGLDYGGEVIVPNFSFIASATAALDRRFGVAFVDVDPQTLLLDARRVEEAIVPGRTRAIMPVHLYGQPADMTSLRTVADKHGLVIIEDAAQAHGAVWETGPVGSLGDAGGFSFQSSKNLACGEGGALVTNNEQIFERAYSMHNAGRSWAHRDRWVHVQLGWNCRPTEYQAALLLHRLKFFDRQQAVRRRNFAHLRDLMAGVKCLEPIGVHARVRAHGMYMFAMRYRPELCGGLPVNDFLDYARAEGAPIYRAFETTMSNQPSMLQLMKKRPQYFRVLPTPVADQAVKDNVYIAHPVFLGVARDMEDIAAAVTKVERHFAGRDGPVLSA
jgi:dTDP-4-amino-4,6-dideoxygalactose transaminase